MKKILITDSPTAKEIADKFLPRVILTRAEAENLAEKEAVEDIILDGNDTSVFAMFPNAVKTQYSDTLLDFTADSDTINKALKGLCEYVKPAPVMPKPEDDFITGDCLSATNPPSDSDDEYDSDEQEIPLPEQIKILDPILQDRKVGAGTIAELSSQVVAMCKQHGLFVHDICTGLYKTVFAKKPLVSEALSQMIFTTHFIDKLAIKKNKYKVDKNTGETISDTTFVPIKPKELELVWKNVSAYSTFNSRIELYRSIPEWDGVPRIATFMKDYFNCDANPNFFLLLITCIIGKIHNPTKNYTPFFFDLVSQSRGIGKTLLWTKLVGKKYVSSPKMNKSRGYSDFFVDIYDGNAIIALDDECKWCGQESTKMSHDEFKDLVSQQLDKFSRKHGQPETHERCFIIARTSNYVNQVFEPTERRQIIFKCNLPERECRIFNLPDEFWKQILAEGKAYYQKHGIYELTDEDWKEVMSANLDNFNYETPENFIIMDYINAIREDSAKWGVVPSASKFQDRTWGNYKKYVEYCVENKKTPVKNRNFWRNVEAMASLPELAIEVISDTKYELKNGGKSRLFAVDPLPKTEEEKSVEEIADIPF